MNAHDPLDRALTLRHDIRIYRAGERTIATLHTDTGAPVSVAADGAVAALAALRTALLDRDEAERAAGRTAALAGLKGTEQ